jgi:hypothetical protein
MADDRRNNRIEEVRVRSEQLQRIADDAVAGTISPEDAVTRIRATNATRAETNAIMDQINERFEAEYEQVDVPGRDELPEDLLGDGVGGQQERTPEESPPDDEVGDNTYWATVMVQAASLRRGIAAAQKDADVADTSLAAILGSLASSTSTTVSESVLRTVPGLSDLSAGSGSEHLDKTFQRRKLFAAEKSLDPLVDLLQCKQLEEPIPRTIWRDVIQDRLVNFEKLFASMDSAYNHNDDISDFHAGYALVKKEHISAKKPLTSEADWIRVFGAWEAAVVTLYEHRKTELQGYRRIVNEVFRATPHDPLIAIRFDAEVRDRYSRAPFRLDDRLYTNAPLLTEMFKASSRVLGKRTSTSTAVASQSKRSTVVCINWNLGRCADPCANRRKHGSCSECAADHRAKDSGQCLSSLQAKRSGGTSDRRGASATSS